MSDFSFVPVVDVHRDNFKGFWPSIILACKNATFIALDTELSGLGRRQKLVAKDLDERYKAIADVAKTRAILSLGVSCFSHKQIPPDEQPATSAAHFAVQTFNITTLCDEDYMVEPAAVQFLVDHGFDFNKQYAKGITYHRGADTKDSDDSAVSIRNLFNEILMCKKPIVVHNGLVDMAFLYHNFYTTLPATYPQFVVDLSEMYVGGLFDTKYLAEFITRLQSSYLEYVFRKCQRDNQRMKMNGERHVALTFPDYNFGSKFVESHPCSLPTNDGSETERETTPICKMYSAHGFCNGKSCDGTHNLDVILDTDHHQEKQKRDRRSRKRKRTKLKRRERTEKTPIDSEITDQGSKGETDVKDDDGTEAPCPFSDSAVPGSTEDARREQNGGAAASLPKQHGSHRAGFDAFMTGFALACVINGYGRFPTKGAEGELLSHFGMGGEANKLFLSAKNIPMIIAKSAFAKSSPAHREKMRRLQKRTDT